MDRSSWIGPGVVVAVIAAGAAAYFLYGPGASPPIAAAPAAPPPAAPAPSPTADAVPRYPVGDAPPSASSVAAPAPKPLPELEASDAPLLEELAQRFGAAPVQSFLVPQDLIKHWVATVDALDRDSLPLRLRPVRPTAGRFLTQGGAATATPLTLDTDNSARYVPMIDALTAADPQTIAALYRHWYPLFQRAYVELGYPQRYFNDRLVAVIDHLLAAPEPVPPVALAQPKVFYEYADADLEARSCGQKALMRLGPEHERRVKQWLRGLRAAVVRRKAAE